MKRDAFFYMGRYYLLPKDVRDVRALTKKHGDGAPFEVMALSEEKCMPPYFLEQNVSQEALALEPEHDVYPCEVELLSQREYNARLREVVKAHCPGCPNFGSVDETDASLEGHHGEIALNGACFLKEQYTSSADDFNSFSAVSDEFAERFGALGLEQMIDEGRTGDAIGVYNGLFSQMFGGIEMLAHFDKCDGGYMLVTTSVWFDQDRLLMECLYERLAARYGDRWTFKNHVPRGVFLDGAVRPLAIHARPEEAENSPMEVMVTVYAPTEALLGAYLWMCGQYGEALLHNGEVAMELAEAEVLSECPPGAIAPEALWSVIGDASEWPEDDDSLPMIHAATMMPNDVDPDDEALAAGTILFASRCVDLCNQMVFPLIEDERPEGAWAGDDMVSAFSIPVARIAFDAVDFDDEAALDRLFADLVDGLEAQGVCKAFARAGMPGEGSAEAYLLVLSLTDFLYAVRRYAPLFDRYPASMEIYTASGTSGGYYRLGYDMTRVLTEPELLDDAEDLIALNDDALDAIDDDIELVETIRQGILHDAASLEWDPERLRECLSSPQWACYVAMTMDEEIQNGGLRQFFANASRAMAGCAAPCLRQVGAAPWAALYERFLSDNAIDPNRLDEFAIDDPDDFGTLLDRYPFDDFDDAWYDLGDLETALARYIRTNASAF